MSSPRPRGHHAWPLPANRNLVYPYIMLALVTDQFKVTRDLNRIARTEDLQFGWNGTLQLGWSSPSLVPIAMPESSTGS